MKKVTMQQLVDSFFRVGKLVEKDKKVIEKFVDEIYVAESSISPLVPFYFILGFLFDGGEVKDEI